MTEIRYDKHLFGKQWPFVRSGAPETLFSGGVGCGKTIALIRRELQMCIRYPGSIGILGCFTYPMLRDILKPILYEHLEQWPRHLWHERKSDQIIEIKVNQGPPSQIWLRHLEDEGRRKGASVDRVSITELSVGITEAIYMRMLSNLRRGTRQHISADTNPDSTEHWIYKRWFREPQPSRRLIQAKSTDNPHLPETYLAMLSEQSEAWQRRNVLGEWGIMEGVVYGEFDRDFHVAEFEPDPNWRWFLAIDFGFTNPFACLWIGIDGNNNTYIYDEHHVSRMDTDIHAVHCSGLEICPACHRVHGFKGFDPIAAVIDTSAPGDFRIFKRVMGERGVYFSRRPGKKDVKYGIELCKIKLRSRGPGARVTIHPRCVKLLEEMGTYEWLPAVEGRRVKESPNKIRDHSLDAWRYFEATIGSK